MTELEWVKSRTSAVAKTPKRVASKSNSTMLSFDQSIKLSGVSRERNPTIKVGDSIVLDFSNYDFHRSIFQDVTKIHSRIYREENYFRYSLIGTEEAYLRVHNLIVQQELFKNNFDRIIELKYYNTQEKIPKIKSEDITKSTDLTISASSLGVFLLAIGIGTFCTSVFTSFKLTHPAFSIIFAIFGLTFSFMAIVKKK